MAPGRRLARARLQAPDVGASVVFLAPGHARAHPQDIADRDALIGRAAQPRQVEVAAIVQAADRAVVERGADERRGHRLRGREARPTALRAAAHAVALQRDLAVLQDQEPGRAAAGHVVAEAEADVAHLKGQVRERTGVRRQRPHRVAAPDDAVRPAFCLRKVAASARAVVFAMSVSVGVRWAMEPSSLETASDRPGWRRLQSKLSWFVLALSRWRARARPSPEITAARIYSAHADHPVRYTQGDQAKPVDRCRAASLVLGNGLQNSCCKSSGFKRSPLPGIGPRPAIVLMCAPCRRAFVIPIPPVSPARTTFARGEGVRAE